LSVRPGTRRDLLLGAALAWVVPGGAPRPALAAATTSARSAALPDAAQLAQWMQPTAGGPARFLMMRHAQTVAGTGDPPGYRLNDCATQRNLAESGREQARALALLLQQSNLRFDQVRASRWCRCLETARLAFGQVEAWPALDSFFDAPDRGPTQLAELRQALRLLVPSQRVAWVTHQVVITGLTGLWPASGEVLILEAGASAQPPTLIARFIP
jgi:phosphohistidine phosphatase SixA